MDSAILQCLNKGDLPNNSGMLLFCGEKAKQAWENLSANGNVISLRSFALVSWTYCHWLQHNQHYSWNVSDVHGFLSLTVTRLTSTELLQHKRPDYVTFQYPLPTYYLSNPRAYNNENMAQLLPVNSISIRCLVLLKILVLGWSKTDIVGPRHLLVSTFSYVIPLT